MCHAFYKFGLVRHSASCEELMSFVLNGLAEDFTYFKILSKGLILSPFALQVTMSTLRPAQMFLVKRS